MLVQGYGLTETSPVISTGTLSEHRSGHGRQADRRRRSEDRRRRRDPHPRPARDGRLLELARGHGRDDSRRLAAHGRPGLRWKTAILRITGRKKELIVTAGGKNIAPTYLEGLLTEDPLIAQAVVIGDAQELSDGPDRARPGRPAGRDHQAADSRCSRRPRRWPIPTCEAMYAERIKRRLADVSHAEQVAEVHAAVRGIYARKRRIDVQAEPASATSMPENFAAEIEAMYGE